MGIFDIFGTGDQQQAAQDQIAALNRGYGQLSDLFNQGRGALSTQYAQGLAPFTNQFNVGNAGQTQLAALLGLGGGGGSSGGIGPTTGANGNMVVGSAPGPGGGTPAAGGGGANSMQQTLQNLPGYQFALDQGSQNILRNQAATGQLNSGATNLDLMNYGQGLANQNYFNYANQLLPFMNTANTAASGIGGLQSGLGNQLNNSFMTQGNAAFGTQAGIGNAQAQADLAGLTQSGNIIGAGLGLGSALLMSDERAKDDIEPVGELYDGQPVFRYRYKGDHRHQIGLIAQNVERERPDAVGNIGGGFKGVNYKRATEMAADLGRFLKAA
jgi:hypothetical protein